MIGVIFGQLETSLCETRRLISGSKQQIVPLRKKHCDIAGFRYGIDGLGPKPWWGRYFPFTSTSALRPTQPPVQREYWIPFLGVKGLRRSIDYLSTFSAYVRNRWSSTSVSFLYLQWHVTGDVYIAGVLRRTFRQEVVGSWIKLFNLLKTKRRLLFKDPGRTAQ